MACVGDQGNIRGPRHGSDPAPARKRPPQAPPAALQATTPSKASAKAVTLLPPPAPTPNPSRQHRILEHPLHRPGQLRWPRSPHHRALEPPQHYRTPASTQRSSRPHAPHPLMQSSHRDDPPQTFAPPQSRPGSARRPTGYPIRRPDLPENPAESHRPMLRRMLRPKLRRLVRRRLQPRRGSARPHWPVPAIRRSRSTSARSSSRAAPPIRSRPMRVRRIFDRSPHPPTAFGSAHRPEQERCATTDPRLLASPRRCPANPTTQVDDPPRAPRRLSAAGGRAPRPVRSPPPPPASSPTALAHRAPATTSRPPAPPPSPKRPRRTHRNTPTRARSPSGDAPRAQTDRVGASWRSSRKFRALNRGTGASPVLFKAKPHGRGAHATF
jgi:hypothetical protein